MVRKKLHIMLSALIALSMAGILLSAPVQASELRVGFTLDALTLDPANHRKRETETILRNIYDGLVTRDRDMKVVPELAESFQQIDPTTYEFKLRKGVKFHNGATMTAEDVKFTFDRLIVEGAMDGQTSPRKSLLSEVKEVQIVDENTIRFILSHPWPIFPAMLPFQEVVNKKFVEKVGAQGMATQTNGTGPFKLVEWRKGEAIIMDRFDDYYGGAEAIKPVGKACVDRVIFKIIPENASRVAALLAGDVDIVNDLPTHMINQVKNNPGTKVMTVNGTRSFFIALNTQQQPFNDIRVRQAANHALNKQLIIDKILNGTATPLNGILSPDAFGHNPNLTAFDYDPKLAMKLLAEAGFPNGIEVTLDVEGAYKDTAEVVASLLSKVGIHAQVVVGEGSQLKKKWTTRGAPKEGDMWFTSWGNGSLDPVGIFVPVLRSNERGNSSGYTNAEVDKLLDDANVEIDVAKREKFYQRAEAIVNRDAPLIFLWVPQDIYGVSNRLSGWQPSADSRINLHDACIN